MKNQFLSSYFIQYCERPETIKKLDKALVIYDLFSCVLDVTNALENLHSQDFATNGQISKAHIYFIVILWVFYNLTVFYFHNDLFQQSTSKFYLAVPKIVLGNQDGKAADIFSMGMIFRTLLQQRVMKKEKSYQ